MQKSEHVWISDIDCIVCTQLKLQIPYQFLFRSTKPGESDKSTHRVFVKSEPEGNARSEKLAGSEKLARSENEVRSEHEENSYDENSSGEDSNDEDCPPPRCNTSSRAPKPKELLAANIMRKHSQTLYPAPREELGRLLPKSYPAPREELAKQSQTSREELA